jgi:cytochrome b6-f complex iron-sulfur subunit
LKHIPSKKGHDMAASTRPTPTIDKPNRREFLYYVGGASLALLTAGSCGALVRFMNPPLRGEEGGFYEVDLDLIPKINANPVGMRDGRYWLVNIDGGLLALSGVCSFMIGSRPEGSLPKWVPTNQRFECPGCGSKYELDGTHIEGPAQRSLHRFTVEVTTPDGRLTTPSDGSPVNIIGSTHIIVDTNRIIYGQVRQG